MITGFIIVFSLVFSFLAPILCLALFIHLLVTSKLLLLVLIAITILIAIYIFDCVPVSFNPMCLCAIMVDLSLFIILIESFIAILLAISKFVGVIIFKNVEAYYFLILFILFTFLTIVNLIKTRKGIEIDSYAINVIIMFVGLKEVLPIIRYILLLISAFMKFFLKEEVPFAPLMEAVVISIAFETITKPYCHAVDKTDKSIHNSVGDGTLPKEE